MQSIIILLHVTYIALWWSLVQLRFSSQSLDVYMKRDAHYMKRDAHYMKRHILKYRCIRN